MPTTSAASQPAVATASDPLLEQSSHNKLTDHVPRDSGSLPSSDSETPLHGSDQKNLFEEKLEQAFDKSGHDKEVSGAGVGNHPMA